MTTTTTTCARCGTDASHGSIVSKFNTDVLCMDCKAREVAHPAYAEADRAEVDAVRQGDLNFPGIGAPAVLYQRPCKAEEFILSVRHITGAEARAARANSPGADPDAPIFQFPDGSLAAVSQRGSLRVLAYS